MNQIENAIRYKPSKKQRERSSKPKNLPVLDVEPMPIQPADYAHSVGQMSDRSRCIRAREARAIRRDDRFALIAIAGEASSKFWWDATWLMYACYDELRKRDESRRSATAATHGQMERTWAELGISAEQIARKLGKLSSMEQRMMIAEWIVDLDIDERDYPYLYQNPSHFNAAIYGGKDNFSELIKNAEDNRYSWRQIQSQGKEIVRKKRDSTQKQPTNGAGSTQPPPNDATWEPGERASYPLQQDVAQCRRSTAAALDEIERKLVREDFSGAESAVENLGNHFLELYDAIVAENQRQKQNSFEVRIETT